MCLSITEGWDIMNPNFHQKTYFFFYIRIKFKKKKTQIWLPEATKVAGIPMLWESCAAGLDQLVPKPNIK